MPACVPIRLLALLLTFAVIGVACTGTSDEDSPSSDANQESDGAQPATESTNSNGTDTQESGEEGPPDLYPRYEATEIEAEAEIRSVDDVQNCFVDDFTLLAINADVALDAYTLLEDAEFELEPFPVPDDTDDALEVNSGSRSILPGQDNVNDQDVPRVIEIVDGRAREAIRLLAEETTLVEDNLVAPHYLNGFVMGWSMIPGEEITTSSDEFSVTNIEADDPAHVLVIDSGFESRENGIGMDPFAGRVTGEPEVIDVMSPVYGHGTFVAGIIAQVNPAARVTVLAVSPIGNDPTIWSMDGNSLEAPMALEETVFSKAVTSEAEVKEVDDQVDVINFSLGAYMCNVPTTESGQLTGFVPAPPIGLAAAVDQLESIYPGADIVAGAGNDGLNIGGTAMGEAQLDVLDAGDLAGVFPFYPAAEADVLAVGAVGMDLAIAQWEMPLPENPNTLGGPRGSNYGEGLLWAPGKQVVSSFPTLGGGSLTKATWGGTSFATACVSGLLSLQDPNLGLPGSITSAGTGAQLIDDAASFATATAACWEFAD